jgi:uncharacterized protein YlzI (FlbEa/FlbD family)
MSLIKLTRPDGKELYVSPEQVCSVEESVTEFARDGRALTRITFITGEHRPVTETVYEVVAMLRRQD